MIESKFYESLSEELTNRGFFIVTNYAPENCIGICGINGTEKRIKYIEYLQKHYRLAAIKNIIFTIGQDECAGGFFEILIGSQTQEPFPMIFLHFKYNEHYYNMAYQCRDIARFSRLDNYGDEATKYMVECIKFMTKELMDVLHQWIVEGQFPALRFGESDELPKLMGNDFQRH